jgi:hypothetical protein
VRGDRAGDSAGRAACVASGPEVAYRYRSRQAEPAQVDADFLWIVAGVEQREVTVL